MKEIDSNNTTLGTITNTVTNDQGCAATDGANEQRKKQQEEKTIKYNTMPSIGCARYQISGMDANSGTGRQIAHKNQKQPATHMEQAGTMPREVANTCPQSWGGTTISRQQ